MRISAASSPETGPQANFYARDFLGGGGSFRIMGAPPRTHRTPCERSLTSRSAPCSWRTLAYFHENGASEKPRHPHPRRAGAGVCRVRAVPGPLLAGPAAAPAGCARRLGTVPVADSCLMRTVAETCERTTVGLCYALGNRCTCIGHRQFLPAGLGGPTRTYTASMTSSAVPEPITMGLLAMGLAGLAARRRRA